MNRYRDSMLEMNPAETATSFAHDGSEPEEPAMTPEELEHYRHEAGLHRSVKLPAPGTPAFMRLMEHAEAFMRYANGPSPQMAAAREELIEKFQDRRRKHHNELSNMVLGRTWNDLSDIERRQVSNLAALLTNHENLVGTF